MGACCSSSSYGERDEGLAPEERQHERDRGEGHHRRRQYNNATDSNVVETHVMFEGSSKYTSMFTQQGRKGVNQDAMTVWENFNGEKDTYFCAVFDGHGPSGHLVAQQVRDLLPPRLCSLYKKTLANRTNPNVKRPDNGADVGGNSMFSLLKTSLIKSFEEVDRDICENASIDTYFSGTTSVAVLKQREHLVIANLGDSRAVLCTRGDTNQLLPIQLTVDLKPNLKSEAERIRSCHGRVFAMEEEPQVYRMWMPQEDCPGLAMARAFGDFCLKDFGLISTPEIFYRRITDKDEFVVLATDGVWDVLSNYEVINIVASARKQSLAARQLVDHAVRAWRHKYPGSKVDDCAAICLFFHNRPLLTKSTSDSASGVAVTLAEIPASQDPKIINTDDGLDTVVNCDVNEKPLPPPPGLPRSFSHGLSRRTRKGSK